MSKPSKSIETNILDNKVALSTCYSNEAVQVTPRKRRKRPLQATVPRGDGGGRRGGRSGLAWRNDKTKRDGGNTSIVAVVAV